MTHKLSNRRATIAARFHVRVLLITTVLAVFASGAFTQTVRVIEPLKGDLANDILRQVDIASFTNQNTSPILLEGESVATLRLDRVSAIRETYRAGYSIVLLDPTLLHVRQLHALLGEGINYRMASASPLQSYSIRKVNGIPTTVLLFSPPSITLDGTPRRVDVIVSGGPAKSVIHRQAVERTIAELKHTLEVATPPVRDPNQPVSWQEKVLQTTTLAINDDSGVYNTAVDLYALHRCLDNTDHYVVTAGADWTSTHAHFESAGSQDGDLSTDGNGNLRVNWHDNGLNPDNVNNCGSPGYGFYNEQHLCRYVNYPLSYNLTMVPPPNGTVLQVNAAPGGSQGQTTSYTSGFSFNIGGTVNVSAAGPGGGISGGATWTNTTTTTVPPLQVNAGNTGNEGAFWQFQYCTDGAENDQGKCTSHVQTNNGCRNRFGNNEGGGNPQQGQTKNGKFSNAVQSVHWQANPDTRVNGNTFDIDVNFSADIANTVANLYDSSQPDPNPGGCSGFDNCSCTSWTSSTSKISKITFSVPFPSTSCPTDRSR